MSFSRDPSLRSVEAQVTATLPQKDIYRDRNVLAGAALVVAVISIPATIASAIWPMDQLALYVIGGVPITLAILGLVASIKLGFPTRMAWIAVAISVVTMGSGFVVAAQQTTVDLQIPTVQDVPGVGQITELETENGLNG